MKDKLVKTNKKRRYYVTRNILVTLLVLAAVSATVIIPIYAKSYNQAHTVLINK